VFVGYARVSTQDQKPELQLDALTAKRCERVFEEKASGAQRDRPELKAALDYMRQGDTLVVWKLDRLVEHADHPPFGGRGTAPRRRKPGLKRPYRPQGCPVRPDPGRLMGVYLQLGLAP